MLRNIEYIGDNNLMYTIDNQKEKYSIKLYKNIDFLNLYIGAYSKIDDMKVLTKSIEDSIKSKKKKKRFIFLFFMIQQKKVLNFNMSG